MSLDFMEFDAFVEIASDLAGADLHDTGIILNPDSQGNVQGYRGQNDKMIDKDDPTFRVSLGNRPSALVRSPSQIASLRVTGESIFFA